MDRHADVYTDLLRRRFTGDPSLTAAERRALDGHLLTCPQCNYDYAELLLRVAPERATRYLERLAGDLTPDLVAPFLAGLARARREARPLTGFQQMVWQFACRDPAAMARLRELEAGWDLEGLH